MTERLKELFHRGCVEEGRIPTRHSSLHTERIDSQDLFRKVNADFRDDRKPIDDFHIARQLHEKCQEQKADLYMAIVNFTKNLNKVVRDLRRYGLSK